MWSLDMSTNTNEKMDSSNNSNLNCIISSLIFLKHEAKQSNLIQTENIINEAIIKIRTNTINKDNVKYSPKEILENQKILAFVQFFILLNNLEFDDISNIAMMLREGKKTTH